MVSKFTNEYLRQNTKIQSNGQILFFQKMMELLYKDTPIADAYRIHNAYTILQELDLVIGDYFNSKINAIAVAEVFKEAKILFGEDVVIKSKDPAFYSALKIDFNRQVQPDKNQSFNEETLTNIYCVRSAIQLLFKQYSPIDYQKLCTNLLKSAIDSNNNADVLLLSQCLISSFIGNNRSLRNIYNDIIYYFNNNDNDFNINWNKWVANSLIYEASYICFVECPPSISFVLSEELVDGVSIKESYFRVGQPPQNANLIKDEQKYYACEITAPANDIGYIMDAAFSKFLKIKAVIDFSSEHEIEWSDSAIIYDIYRNSLRQNNYEPASYQYRPYKQYRQALSRTVHNLLGNMNPHSQEDYSKILRVVACISSLQTANLEYNYLILWSSAETLFRSTQTQTAIANIKMVVPRILTRRYMYYLVFSFIKNCGYCGITPIYKTTSILTDEPQEVDVKNMCDLLRDSTEVPAFLTICENAYLLLLEQAKNLQALLTNSYTIKAKNDEHIKTLEFNLQRMYRVRNKFVHHSEVDNAMEALYKHLIVYLWECVREISYVSQKSSIYDLELLFTHFRLGYATLSHKLHESGTSFNFDLLKTGY